MNKIETLYSSIIENKLSAYNQITTKKLGVCFNIIEIPSKENISVNTAVLTVSVMKNGKRKNAMESSKFAKLMRIIEKNLEHFASCDEPPYFTSLSRKIPNKWYSSLECHRVFLIPVSYVFSVVEHLFSKEVVGQMVGTGLSEISLVISTDSHDSYAQFFN
jgi:hypothetical protein